MVGLFVLMAFSDTVTVYGDGSTQPQVLTGSKLNKDKALNKFGAAQTLGAPIGESKELLLKRLWLWRSH